ncbi:hypothetical protein CDD83_3921 [Cordyceps sp. RAO-2017]|nr:hypothetical protein CDD83_3921 [Cordyceps sp. RAO-2017]
MAEPPDNDTIKPCKRCQDSTAPYTLRNASTCRNCYVEYIKDKAGKRLAVLARDTRASVTPAPRKYIAGLSFGPSSTVMTHVLDGSAKLHSSRMSSPAFESLVVHVDTDLSPSGPSHDPPAQRLLSRYRQRFPNISFEYVHLHQVLRAKTINWASLPGGQEVGGLDGDDTCRLRNLFESLPSATSRSDLLRLLIRSLLLDMALERAFTALLLGHSTTALASLTLFEVANGRGYVAPRQINDGLFTVCTYEAAPGCAVTREGPRKEMPVYYPLRELYRHEIILYLDLVPTLGDLVPSYAVASSSIVSHKNLSLDEIITRYFVGLEGSYSGIVANVVRTVGKLDRVSGQGLCSVCRMPLDEQGDLRWAGELGGDIENRGRRPRLCYGCRRTLNA